MMTMSNFIVSKSHSKGKKRALRVDHLSNREFVVIIYFICLYLNLFDLTVKSDRGRAGIL